MCWAENEMTINDSCAEVIAFMKLFGTVSVLILIATLAVVVSYLSFDPYLQGLQFEVDVLFFLGLPCHVCVDHARFKLVLHCYSA